MNFHFNFGFTAAFENPKIKLFDSSSLPFGSQQWALREAQKLFPRRLLLRLRRRQLPKRLLSLKLQPWTRVKWPTCWDHWRAARIPRSRNCWPTIEACRGLTLRSLSFWRSGKLIAVASGWAPTWRAGPKVPAPPMRNSLVLLPSFLVTYLYSTFISHPLLHLCCHPLPA